MMVPFFVLVRLDSRRALRGRVIGLHFHYNTARAKNQYISSEIHILFTIRYGGIRIFVHNGGYSGGSKNIIVNLAKILANMKYL